MGVPVTSNMSSRFDTVASPGSMNTGMVAVLMPSTSSMSGVTMAMYARCGCSVVPLNSNPESITATESIVVYPNSFWALSVT